MFLAWLIGKDEKTQHILASYGASLSQKFHRDAVIMMKSPNYRRIFPEFSGFNKDSKYDLTGGGYILSTSVGGVLTGFTSGTTDITSKGIGVALIDDPLKSSDSKAALENLESWWGEQMSTRRTNNYAQILIATRFHEKDLHGILVDGDGLYDPIENPFGWRWINIQGLCEDPANDILGRSLGESHWPENSAFAVPVLESQKKIMGSFKFAALYQGVPVAAEGQIIKNSWISIVEEEECPPLDVVWFGVDCAFSEKELADESVICVAGISTRDPGTVYIKDIIKGRWGFPDLLESVKQQHSFYKAKMLCIEKAAAGHSLLQVLRRESKIPVEEMKPQQRSKSVRLQAVSPLLENNRVKIVRGLWSDAFIKELTAFPFVKHDDSVDAFVWALTFYSMKLDNTERAVQDSVLQSRKWQPQLRRDFGDESTYSRLVEDENRVSRRVSPLPGISETNTETYAQQGSSKGIIRSVRGRPSARNFGYNIWD